MMHRRTVLRTLLGSVIATFAAPFSLAGQPAKIPRVGVLSPGSPGPSPLLAAFHQGLRDLGYVEKQTILLEYRFAETRLDRLPGLAADLVAGRVDVIVTVNTTASRAALNATKTIPIIVTWVATLRLSWRILRGRRGTSQA